MICAAIAIAIIAIITQFKKMGLVCVHFRSKFLINYLIKMHHFCKTYVSKFLLYML